MTWLRLIYHYIVYWIVGTTPEAHHWKLAQCWYRLNRYHRCIRHCKAFLDYQESTYVKVMLSDALIAVGDFQQAAATLRSIEDLWSNPELALALADAEMQSGNADEARKIVATVEVSHPNAKSHVVAAIEELRTALGMAATSEDLPPGLASRDSAL